MAEDMKAQVTVSIEDKLSQPLKDMVKVVELMDKSVRTMGDQFGSLADTLLNAAGEFTALLTPIQDAEDSVSALGDTMHGLRIHIKDVEDRLKASETAYGKAERRIDKLEAQIAELSAAMQNLTESHEQANNRVQELTEQMEDMRQEQERVAEAAREAEEAEKSFQARLEKLKAVGEKLSGFGGAMQSAGAAMQRAGIGLMVPMVAGAGFAAFSLRQYAGLEQATAGLKNTFAAGQNADAQMKKILQLAEELGVSLPGSTEDMLRMITVLRQQGVAMEKILGGIAKAAANFATVFGVSFEEAATLMPKFTEAMGIADDKATELVDILQRLQGASGLTTQDLYYTFANAGTALQTFGIQGEESAKGIAAVFGILAKSSVEGATAGTAIRAALTNMAKLDPKATRKLVSDVTNGQHAFSFNLFDKKGKFIGIQNMIREFSTKMSQLTDQQQMVIANKLLGEEGAKAVMPLIKAGMKGYNEMLAEMDKQRSTQQKVDEIMGTIQMKAESLAGTWDTVVKKVGAQVAGMIDVKGILDSVNGLLASINTWIDDNPQSVERIKKQLHVITDLGDYIVEQIKLITKWISDKKNGQQIEDLLTKMFSLPSMLDDMLTKVKQIGKWISGHPKIVGNVLKFMAVLVGMAAPLGGIIITIGTGLVTIGTILGGMGGLVSGIATIVGIVSEASLPLLAAALAAIPVALMAAAEAAAVFALMSKLIYNHWEDIKAFAEGFAKGFASKFGDIQAAAERVKIAFAPVLDMILQALDWLFGTSTADSKAGNMVNGYNMGETFGRIVELILRAIEYAGRLAQVVLPILGAVFKFVYEIGKTAINHIIDFIKRINRANKMIFNVGSSVVEYMLKPLEGVTEKAKEFLGLLRRISLMRSGGKDQKAAAKSEAPESLLSDAKNKGAHPLNKAKAAKQQDIFDLQKSIEDSRKEMQAILNKPLAATGSQQAEIEKLLAKYSPKEGVALPSVRDLNQKNFLQPATNTVNNTDYSKTSFVINVTTTLADPVQVAKIVEKKIQQLMHERDRTKFAAAAPASVKA